MGSKSDYLEKALLDGVLGGSAFSLPATVYLALFTTDPTDVAASGTEATGTGYQRLAITNNATNWPAASGTTATKSNGTVLTMATAGGDWSSGSNMAYWALFDASSGGNKLYYGAITTPKPVLNGDTPSFAIGAISITED